MITQEQLAAYRGQTFRWLPVESKRTLQRLVAGQTLIPVLIEKEPGASFSLSTFLP